jgi:hypothetical protein
LLTNVLQTIHVRITNETDKKEEKRINLRKRHLRQRKRLPRMTTSSEGLLR